LKAPENSKRSEDSDLNASGNVVLTNVEAAHPTIVKFAQFIIDIGQYNVALRVLTQLVEQIERLCGDDSQLLCDPILTIIKLCSMQGTFVYD
jgi:hypothetical protein